MSRWGVSASQAQGAGRRCVGAGRGDVGERAAERLTRGVETVARDWWMRGGARGWQGRGRGQWRGDGVRTRIFLCSGGGRRLYGGFVATRGATQHPAREQGLSKCRPKVTIRETS